MASEEPPLVEPFVTAVGVLALFTAEEVGCGSRILRVSLRGVDGSTSPSGATDTVEVPVGFASFLRVSVSYN